MTDTEKMRDAAQAVVDAYVQRFEVRPGRTCGPIDDEIEDLRAALASAPMKEAPTDEWAAFDAWFEQQPNLGYRAKCWQAWRARAALAAPAVKEGQPEQPLGASPAGTALSAPALRASAPIAGAGRLAALVLELAEAVDNAADDIGGSRPQLDILRDAVQAAHEIGGKQ